MNYKLDSVESNDSKNAKGDNLYGIMATFAPASALCKGKPVTVPINTFKATDKAGRDKAFEQLQAMIGTPVNVEAYNVPESFTKGSTTYKAMTLANWWVGDDEPTLAQKKLDLVSQYCALTGKSGVDYDGLPQLIKSITFGSRAVAAAVQQAVGMPEEA
jgi:hypothetical protein